MTNWETTWKNKFCLISNPLVHWLNFPFLVPNKCCANFWCVLGTASSLHPPRSVSSHNALDSLWWFYGTHKSHLMTAIC
jgi:hypothetical protein